MRVAAPTLQSPLPALYAFLLSTPFPRLLSPSLRHPEITNYPLSPTPSRAPAQTLRELEEEWRNGVDECEWAREGWGIRGVFWGRGKQSEEARSWWIYRG